MARQYFLGNGEILIGNRNATSGLNEGYLSIGNSPSVKLTGKTTFLTHKESLDGQQITDLKIPLDKMLEINIEFEEVIKQNLALAYWSNIVAVTGSTATGELFTNGYTVVAGDLTNSNAEYKLAHSTISSLVVTDSAGSPATLVLNTDYTADLVFGTVKIINLGSYVQPFKAAYTYGASTQLGILTQNIVEKAVLFKGINVVNGKNVMFELYRVEFEPTKDFNWIDEKQGKFAMVGEVLQDTNRAASATLGRFGYIEQIP